MIDLKATPNELERRPGYYYVIVKFHRKKYPMRVGKSYPIPENLECLYHRDGKRVWNLIDNNYIRWLPDENDVGAFRAEISKDNIHFLPAELMKHEDWHDKYNPSP